MKPDGITEESLTKQLADALEKAVRLIYDMSIYARKVNEKNETVWVLFNEGEIDLIFRDKNRAEKALKSLQEICPERSIRLQEEILVGRNEDEN